MSKLGIIVTTFNRPSYLKQCFESLQRAEIPEGTTVIVVDDASTDSETINILNSCPYAVLRKSPNRGIKDSLLKGYAHCFGGDSEIVINLDGDAIVRPDFLKVLIALKTYFPDNIVSGFNTTVKNRNPIIETHEYYFKKKYASGINMVINKDQYEKYIKPALLGQDNWDYQASLLHEKDGKEVIVSRPSVVQHIGIETSSMGHISESEPPDVATDFIYSYPADKQPHNLNLWLAKGKLENAKRGKFSGKLILEEALKKLYLPNVTLFGIAYNDPEGLHRAAEISQRDIQFGDVVIITEKLFDGRVGYSHFCMKELNKYIKTDFFIKIEPDGYIQNAAAWNPKWLEYDLIGSPWEWYQDDFKVGNGISLRSKRLQDILANDPFIVPTNDQYIKEMEEDHNISRIYRPYLEREYGIKFAPLEEARKFGIEAWRSDNDTYNGQFVFHGYRVKGLPFPPLPKVKPIQQ